VDLEWENISVVEKLLFANGELLRRPRENRRADASVKRRADTSAKRRGDASVKRRGDASVKRRRHQDL
jgi:hypothetical protein